MVLSILVKQPFENIVGKGENAGNQHFLLFLQCFLLYRGEGGPALLRGKVFRLVIQGSWARSALDPLGLLGNVLGQDTSEPPA